MIALICTFGDFHFAQQSVHFFDGQPAVGADCAINIIDLANIFSCSFIATSDVGKLYDDGSFEITGRMDNSDLRGCSLLVV